MCNIVVCFHIHVHLHQNNSSSLKAPNNNGTHADSSMDTSDDDFHAWEIPCLGIQPQHHIKLITPASVCFNEAMQPAFKLSCIIPIYPRHTHNKCLRPPAPITAVYLNLVICITSILYSTDLGLCIFLDAKTYASKLKPAIMCNICITMLEATTMLFSYVLEIVPARAREGARSATSIDKNARRSP